MHKTLVIFDIDGTLVYSNSIDSQCFAQTYETIYRLPLPTIDWTKYPHVTDTAIFRTVIQQHFQREVVPEEIHVFQDHYVGLLEQNRHHSPHEFNEVPHAKRTVDALLADENYVVAIATGGWHRPAMVKLRHVGIPAERLFVSCADGHETREGIIEKAIELAAAVHGKPTHIIYVGDAVWDVHVTRRMGMKFVGIRRLGDFEVLEKEGSNFVLQDYSDFELFKATLHRATPPISF